MALILIPDRTIIDEIIEKEKDTVFDWIIEIKSISGCQIIIPSQVQNRVNKRFTTDHQASFFSHVDVDNATKDLEGYDSFNSYNVLVKNKTYNPKDTVIFIAEDINLYSIGKLPCYARLFQLNGNEFVKRAQAIMDLAKRLPGLPSFDDIINQILCEI